MPLLESHGTEIIVADLDTDIREGDAGLRTIVVRFPSTEAARGFYESDEYGAIRHFRTDNSTGTLVICDGLD
jgi:uncharacterized protein (DUF1330 family)